MTKADRLDHERFEALKKAVAEVGYFRRGSLVRRYMPCGKPSCYCQGSPPRLHGPYHQWTRKVHGKTVTVRLTPRQAELLSTWIANARQLDRLLKQMEGTAQRLTERRLRQLRKP
jgi:hypothetical protein